MYVEQDQQPNDGGEHAQDDERTDYD